MADGGRFTLPAARDLWLPGAMVTLQFAVWPAGAAAFGATITGGDLLAVGAAAVTAGVALAWRAVVPVAGALTIIGVMRLLTVTGSDEQGIVLLFADLFALYAVALHRTLRVSLVVVSVATAGAVLAERPWSTPAAFTIGNVLVSAALYGAVVAFGRSQRRRAARREAVRVRLATAAAQERAAAATERERLTHELHDVSAHHLTAAVVQLAAAQRLKDPATVAQALDVARTAGRDASRSLHRLVAISGAVPEPGDAAPDLDDVVAGFVRLGSKVELRRDLPGPLRPDVADAVRGIVQEALTNAMRYAPDTVVTVTVAGTSAGKAVTVAGTVAGTPAGDAVTVAGTAAGDAVTVDVCNTAPPVPTGGFDLGSGGGLPAMRARAERLGGSLTAGPAEDGGWHVRAVLPVAPAGKPAGTRPRRHDLDSRAFDPLLIVLAGTVPLFLAEVGRAEEGYPSLFTVPAEATAAVLFLAVYSGLLWWRRRAPVLVLAGMLVTATCAALWSRVDPPHLGLEVVVIVALFALTAPVYATARHGRHHPGLSWLTAVLAGWGAAMTGLVAFGDTHELTAADGPTAAAALVFFTAVSGMFLALAALPFWGTGALVARHRNRADRRDRVALHEIAERAAQAARDERARIAEGLRDRVLHHTTALIAAGDLGPGHVDAALGHARAALGAMRELLTVLRVGPAALPRSAQPTLAGLADLCRPAGRTVADLVVNGAGRHVPLEVELCAFRLVEAVLPGSAGHGGGQVRVTVEQATDVLRLSVEHLAEAVPKPVLAALRERVDAVGGSLTTTRADDGWRVEVSLPMTEVLAS